MRTAPQDAPGRLVTVTGEVSNGGGVLTGSGFTASRTGTGTYTIRFAPRFRALLSFTAMTLTGNTVAVGQSGTLAPDSINVLTYASSTNAATDAWFAFTAAGIAL
jgi:hypothetical protein